MKSIKFKLYIGTNDESTAERAKQEDKNAYLITADNLNDDHSGVAYTSLPDLGDHKNLSLLCNRADIIVYSPPDEWLDTDRTSKKFLKSEQRSVERVIMPFTLAKDKIIINCPPNNVWKTISPEQQSVLLGLADQRNTDDVQLWTVGCSFTYGMGVPKDKRYATLLSNRLNLPLALLARPATSITWARDQILRSDIRKNDLVVWGITSWNRYAHYNEDKNTLEHIHAGYFQWFPSFNQVSSPDRLMEPTLLYNAINAIEQVINFCDKVGAKLILAGLLISPNLGEYLKNKYTNYIHLIDFWGEGDLRYLDLAPNDLHPGLLSHEYYASNIINLAQELGYV